MLNGFHPTPKTFAIVMGLVALALVAGRDPAFLLVPRLWAEEGSIYLQTFLDRGLLDSLWRPHLGYYSLFNNAVIGIGMALFGLQWIALCTTVAALVFMLAVVLAPCWLHSSLWDSLPKKFALILFSLLLGSAEIWLNTINMQFYFGLYACYFLLADRGPTSRAGVILSRALLLVAALSGVTTVILLPFFVLKAFLRRHHHWLQDTQADMAAVAIVGAGFVVQVLAFLLSTNEYAQYRLSADFLANLPAGLFRTLSFAFRDDSTLVGSAIALSVVALSGNALMQSAKARAVLVLALYILGVFTVLSVGMLGGERYAYIVSILIMMLVINGSVFDNKSAHLVATLALAAFAIHKLSFFRDTQFFHDPDWSTFSAEYQRVMVEQGGELRLFPQWPETDWKVVIPGQSRESSRSSPPD